MYKKVRFPVNYTIENHHYYDQSHSYDDDDDDYYDYDFDADEEESIVWSYCMQGQETGFMPTSTGSGCVGLVLAFGVVNYICWFNQGHLQTVHYKNFMQFLVLCFFYTIVVLCNLMSKQFYSVYKLDKATIHYIHSQHKSQDGSWDW